MEQKQMTVYIGQEFELTLNNPESDDTIITVRIQEKDKVNLVEDDDGNIKRKFKLGPQFSESQDLSIKLKVGLECNDGDTCKIFLATEHDNQDEVLLTIKRAPDDAAA